MSGWVSPCRLSSGVSSDETTRSQRGEPNHFLGKGTKWTNGYMAV